ICMFRQALHDPCGFSGFPDSRHSMQFRLRRSDKVYVAYRAASGVMKRANGSRRLLAIVLVLLAGCKSVFGTQGPPDDPLFVNRKPLESKAVNTAPMAIPHSEVLPAANPYADRKVVSGEW